MDLSKIDLDKKYPKLLYQNKLAFLAGVFEGEGSFGIWSSGKNNNKRYFRIQIEMSDKDVICQFEDFFNLGTVYPRKPRQEHHKVIYNWRVNGENAVRCAYSMFPFWGDRRQQKFREVIKELKKKYPPTPVKL